MPLLRRLLAAVLIAVVVAGPLRAVPAHGPLVLAAASLQESMLEAARRWADLGHPQPLVSFAASSALARQIEAGAPADLFVSADEDWMDHVQEKGLLKPGTRVSFLQNRLVLVAPLDRHFRLSVSPGFPLAQALGGGRLAMADPQSVPAGRYGRAALERLGVWAAVEGRIAGAENVRAALALVERGAAPLGIVYATDARASKRVQVVGVFPGSSHPPIIYPLAVLRNSTSAGAEPFRRFLLSAEGRAIFARHGFDPG